MLSRILARDCITPTSLAGLIIADRSLSLLVAAPTACVCVCGTEQAGTNQFGLFKPGWSASNRAIGPRDKSGESACTQAALVAPRYKYDKVRLRVIVRARAVPQILPPEISRALMVRLLVAAKTVRYYNSLHMQTRIFKTLI